MSLNVPVEGLLPDVASGKAEADRSRCVGCSAISKILNEFSFIFVEIEC